MSSVVYPSIWCDPQEIDAFNSFFAKLKRNYRTNDEIELRISPTFKKDQFDQIYNALSVDKLAKQLPIDYSNTRSFEFKTQEDKRANFREVFNISDKKVTYQQKIQKDFAIFKTYPYSFNIVSSVEINKTKQDFQTFLNSRNPNESVFEKNQVRYRFSYKNEVEIHLSVICKDEIPFENMDEETFRKRVLSSEKNSYQVEIEGIGNFFSRVPTEVVVNYFKLILIMANPASERISVFSQSMKTLVLDTIRNISCAINKEHNFKIVGNCENKNAHIIFDNKPHSLYYDNIKDLMKSQYAVTNKLDGVYYNLFITKEFVALINNVNIELLIANNSIKIQELTKTLSLSDSNYYIFVGELYKNHFNIFDVIVKDGKFVAKDTNLMNRLWDIGEVINQVKKYTIPISVKKFEYKGSLVNLSTNIQDTITYMRKTFGNDFIKSNDGIIFTPVNEGFDATTYKWKFPEKISIDAKLKQVSVTNSEGKIIKKFEMLFNKDKNLISLDPPAFVEIDSQNQLYQLIQEDSVVEINWENNKFHVDRIRYDKKFPNKFDTAENTIKQMKKPLTYETLLDIVTKGVIPEEYQSLSMSEKPYREYCNLVKRLILKAYNKEGANILDLGAGNGGDLEKYKDIKPNRLFLVEPYDKHFQELERRIENLSSRSKSFTDKITTIHSEAENTEKIQNDITQSGFTGGITNINMMFSLTFFASQMKMNKLIKTLDLLEDNGTFLCAYMDGDRTLELLQIGDGVIEGPFYKIENISRMSNGPLGFEHKIKFSFKGASVTEEGQFEYLVPISKLNEVLKKVPPGFSLSGYGFLDDFKSIPNSDPDTFNKLQQLYNTFDESEKTLLSLFRWNRYTKNVKIQRAIQHEQQSNLIRSFLKSNETEEIKLKFQLPGETFFRIGVLDDGSCFVNSLLMSLFEESYTELSKTQQKQLRRIVRDEVAESIDFETWLSLSNGSVALSDINPELREKLSRDDQIVFDKIYDEYDRSTNKDIIKFLSDIEENFQSYNTTAIFENCYNKYINHLKADDNSKWIEYNHIICFMMFFDINIIVVSDQTRDVINHASIYPDKKSVMLLNLHNVHYESIFYEKDEEVTTLFQKNDPLVQRLSSIEQEESKEEEKEVEEEEEKEVEEEEEKEVEEEEVEEDLENVKNKITEIVNNYFLFINKKINFEII